MMGFGFSDYESEEIGAINCTKKDYFLKWEKANGLLMIGCFASIKDAREFDYLMKKKGFDLVRADKDIREDIK